LKWAQGGHGIIFFLFHLSLWIIDNQLLHTVIVITVIIVLLWAYM